MAAHELSWLAVSWIVFLFATRSSGVAMMDNRDFKLVKTSQPQMLQLVSSGKAKIKSATLRECAAKCRQRSQDCLSFIYNNKDQSCRLGSWSVASGKFYGHGCNTDRDSSKYTSQRIIRGAGELFTSACCKGDFILRSLSAGQPKCVLYPNKALKFSEAKADCESRGSRMLIFNTRDELTFVQELLHCMDDTWVGLQDNCRMPGIDCKKNKDSRKFFWTDSSELSKDVIDVVTRNLDNSGGKEGCVHLGGKYHENFNDAPCESERFNYICEMDPYPLEEKAKKALYC